MAGNALVKRESVTQAGVRAVEERQVVCPQSWNSEDGFWKIIPALRPVVCVTSMN